MSANLNGGWIWPQWYCRPHESAWMIAHKFGYLNALEGSLLNRALAGRTDDMPFSSSSRRDLFKSMHEERKQGRRASGEDRLRAVLPNEFFGRDVRWLTHRTIRYCPVCLGEWFHASLFQLRALSRCPQHGCALESSCVGCGGKWNFDFDNAEFQQPLCCYHCARPLAGEPPTYDQIFRRAGTNGQRIDELASQVHETCRAAETSWQRDGKWTLLGNSGVEYFLTLWRASGKADCSSLARPSEGSAWMTEMLPAANPNLGAYRQLARVVRAIGRHLAKRVYRRCGHHKRLHFAMRSTIRSAGPYVSVACSLHECACCYALTKWRLQFAELFSVIRRKRGDPDDSVACGKALLRILNWTVGEVLHSFGFAARQIQTCLGVGAESGLAMPNYRRPGASNVGDLVIAGIGAEARLVASVRSPTAVVQKFLCQDRVDDVLGQLALVAVVPLELQDGPHVGSSEMGSWGESAGEWTLPFDGQMGFSRVSGDETRQSEQMSFRFDE